MLLQYISYYNSPLGEILLSSDDIGLTGLWFKNQKFYAAGLAADYKKKDTEFINQAKKWLDIYFAGRNPDFIPELHLTDTDFRLKVWKELLKIPYGHVITYSELAHKINPKSFPRATGNAVGRNKISVIIPCHRVVGKNNSLTGYAGGLERKIQLLKLENSNLGKFMLR